MPTRVYIPTEPYTPTGETIGAPAPAENMLTAPAEQGTLSRVANRLLGTQFGEERYQTWPEKMVRSAATLAGDVVSGAVPVLPPGSRREDFTDEPAPGVPDNAPWWKMAPVAAQPNDLMMERAQDLAGDAQAARYDLSKQINEVRAGYNNSDGTFNLSGTDKNGKGMDLGKKVKPEELADHVGKDLAKKIVEDKGGQYSGLDLKVGGEGMRGFYDDILPKALQKIGKEHGVKVQRGSLPSEATAPYKLTGPDGHDYGHFGSEKQAQAWAENAGFGDAATITKKEVKGEPIFYIDIPQSLRDAAMRKGFPLFSGGKMFVPHQEEDK